MPGHGVEASLLEHHLCYAWAQFVDDVLDFTGSTLQLGKPALNDLRSGLATAPVLYAAQVWPFFIRWHMPGAK